MITKTGKVVVEDGKILITDFEFDGVGFDEGRREAVELAIDLLQKELEKVRVK